MQKRVLSLVVWKLIRIHHSLNATTIIDELFCNRQTRMFSLAKGPYLDQWSITIKIHSYGLLHVTA